MMAVGRLPLQHPLSYWAPGTLVYLAPVSFTPFLSVSWASILNMTMSAILIMLALRGAMKRVVSAAY